MKITCVEIFNMLFLVVKVEYMINSLFRFFVQEIFL